MHRRVLPYSSIILVVFIFSFTHVSGQATDVAAIIIDGIFTVPGTTAPIAAATTAAATTTTTTTTTTTSSKRSRYGYGSRKNNGNNYGRGFDGYYDDDYEVVGTKGRDPSRTGQDFGDFGSVYDNKKPLISQLNLWINEADDWEQKGSGRYGGRGRERDGKYNKNQKYKDNNYNSGSRGKRSYKKVGLPVVHVPKYREFPFRRLPPLISILPWIPIFYDRITYQTFIFSPTGGIYIIPPVINFYGQRFAVAQLIKWGYASLVSSGAPPPPNLDVAPLVQPPPVGGVVTAGVVGSPGAGPAPTYDAKNHRFNDGVKTNFGDFKPRYAQTIEEGGNRNYKPPSGPNYGGDSSYGGTRNQEVYAQGGNQRRGGF